MSELPIHPLNDNEDSGSPAPMPRRTAIRSLGLMSLAAALDLTPPQLERALDGMASLTTTPQPSYTPKFFTSAEWETVRMLSDYVIPRDERSGSATDAKVPEFMDWLLADEEASENSRNSMRNGLAWLDAQSRERFGRTFVEASDAQRRQILDDIAWPAKAPQNMRPGVAFFTRFRDFTASGFFSSEMGWRDVQYMGNVSLPAWNGCPPAALDKLDVSYDLMTTRIPPQ